MGPEDLREIIAKFRPEGAENLIVGIESSDDAGVYRIDDDLALVQTVDLITPIVDDPFLFGRIAAVNSLSDIYAMGAEPLTALNICCFPSKGLPKEQLARVLEGGFDAIREAGAVLAGGHTIMDKEIKYGLSVTGRVHPSLVLTNSGARPGDRLILTKPLGTSTIFAGLGRGLIADTDTAPAVEGMQTLNMAAAEVLRRFTHAGASDRSCAATAGVHALTDVTGFGLAGHAYEMAAGSDVCVILDAAALSAYPRAKQMIAAEALCGGTRNNRKAVETSADFSGASQDDIWLICDAQTSGGLLISVAAAEADELLAALLEAGVAGSTLLGEIAEGPAGKIVLR